ncbi:ABC transporter permease subunit [Tepidimicrobium xylanilyticum]|uniref:Simple sugar transport system permease protein n=1 Tax=Tepidimicrobium xylanilyticum TaxID=1123352 RepID=A0A1H2QHQ9_9FIRM|nr:ABC transporter permease [Tepidimicrobium xylanilyticum]GMG95654.1 ABC transporter [Tepidimicrobium xylanilyticum]SDW06733.1 simple sugar transport system permease protein [Tepidimicrobium xylanilyticum]
MIVPIIFFVICLIGSFFTGLPFGFLLDEIVIRLSRNLLLVMSLILPVITGLGLNFAITLGAIAGQIALIIITNYTIGGFLGFILGILISTPFAILFGFMVGKILNKAKGKEMITSMVLGFFANGIYQLVFLLLAGTIIPIRNKDLLLTSGVGVKNTIDLSGIKYSFDYLIPLGKYPVTTLLVLMFMFLLLNHFLKTKLGQDMRAVGQDMEIARVSGINVERTRIISVILSTLLAAWGQIIFLQNIGTMQTYASHEQVGLFAVASLLVGGATIDRASWKEAIIGTFLFHFLFLISPLAGQNLLGNAQIGEYFRAFVAYGVIGLALVLHAWEKDKSKKRLMDIYN